MVSIHYCLPVSKAVYTKRVEKNNKSIHEINDLKNVCSLSTLYFGITDAFIKSSFVRCVRLLNCSSVLFNFHIQIAIFIPFSYRKLRSACGWFTHLHIDISSVWTQCWWKKNCFHILFFNSFLCNFCSVI